MSAAAVLVRLAPRPRTEAAVAGLLALAAAAAILAFGPAPGDAPAHLYRTLLVRHGNFVWDNLWFGGSYPLVSYSPLYYLPAALVGNLPLVLLSAALSAALFAAICVERWGEPARWPARLGGLLSGAPAFTGLYAYSLGLVCLLGALRALQRRRTALFGLLAALTVGFSPLAFLFLLLVLAASFADRPRVSRRVVVVVALVIGLCAAEAALLKLFPSPGRYPFNVVDFCAVLCVCACGSLLARRAPGGRAVLAFFLLWAAVSILAFVTPSPVGDNITRLRGLILPVMLLAAALARFRPRWLVGLALGVALGYNLVPYLMLIPYRLDSRPEHQRFWAPALAYLATHSSADFRVEVVETAAHWESYWFPRAGFPIVRGWYRQLDLARNPVLFERRTSAPAYRAWLHWVGARYIVLPHTRLDPLAGSREARLVRASNLRLVLATPTVSVYEVARPTPILTGPAAAHLTRLSPGTIAGTLAAAGRYRLRIAATPYMRVQRGAVCLEESGAGVTTLVARAPGPFKLAVPENPLALIDPGSGRAADC